MHHSPTVITLAAAAGLLVGALVVRPVAFAYTVPPDDPVLPRSACPDCGTQLLGRSAAPGAFRRLVLARRCTACAAAEPAGIALRIGPPLLVPEFLTALGAAAVLAGGTTGFLMAAQLWLVAVGSVLLLADFAVHRLPNHLTAAAGAGVGVLLTGAALAEHQWDALMRAVAVALATALWFFVLALLGQGLGDLKLAPTLTALLAWQSWSMAFDGLFLSCVLGVLQWLALKAFSTATRKTEIAFGPALLVGTLVASTVLA
ncbi:A24 family peptidase [Kitasatospora sp. RB6PN24]|uniref:prepilin peptidase n=1 Tax=Kitasatospora humi TaxID=2893891 RepID=UPI001E431312|nr:A24 family peptidase [Kitasatospora humi]MCC9309964.1 A24 family peptidase [Kitasatospora humi]